MDVVLVGAMVAVALDVVSIGTERVDATELTAEAGGAGRVAEFGGARPRVCEPSRDELMFGCRSPRALREKSQEDTHRATVSGVLA